MTPEQLVRTAERGGQVPLDLALRAVRQAGKHPGIDAMTHAGDRLVRQLSPDARLVVDESCCIVLVTPGSRITVSNVADWQEALGEGRQFAAIYAEDAEQARREASLEHGRRWWEARRHIWHLYKAFRTMDKAGQDALTERFLADYDASDTQLSIEDWAPHWALERTDGQQS